MPKSPTVSIARSPQVTAPRTPKVDEKRVYSKYVQSIDQIPWTYTPQSSWVVAFRYWVQRQILQIHFRGGAVCEYKDIPPSSVSRFRSVKSKGRAVWREYYYLPYRLVSAGSGHGRGRFRTPGRKRRKRTR